jgi:hypothetical protein
MTTLLHNMSVPSSSTITVGRAAMTGRRYRVTERSFGASGRTIAQIRVLIAQEGEVALLKLLDQRAPSGVSNSPRALQEICDRALRKVNIPDAIGVFVEEPLKNGGPSLDLAAAIAVLARRSGPLYLPNRFEPSLVSPCNVTLFFAVEVCRAQRS